MNQNYLDAITTISFAIGLMNLQENLTQGDKQELMNEFSDKADILLTSIDGHLKKQDEHLSNQDKRFSELERKINEILLKLQEGDNIG